MASFPCEQTDTDALRDQLTGALIGLARDTEGNDHMITGSTAHALVEGLLTVSNAENLDREVLLTMTETVTAEKQKLVPECFRCACPCGRTFDYDMKNLQKAPENIRSLKLQILSRCCDAAACRKDEAASLLYRALYAVGMDDWDEEELLPIARELEDVIAKL